MNWNDNQAQAITLDFVLMGAATTINQECAVTDLWSGSLLGKFKGFLNSPLINPHDNVAYKIVCNLAASE